MLVIVFFVFLSFTLSPWVESAASNMHFPSYLGRASASRPSASISSSTPSSEAPNASEFFYVGASTNVPSIEQNTGVRSLIQVKSQDVRGVLSFWISEATANNMWAQAGYYIDNGSKPTAFYQIWNLTDRTEVTTGTESVSSGIHLFSIASVLGTDSWNFTLDGRSFGTYDMGSNLSSATYPIYALSEEGYISAPFTFEPVLFQSAIQVLKQGSWSNASSASSYGSDWGLEGHAQDSMLGNNEFQVGSGYGQIAGNSDLWLI